MLRDLLQFEWRYHSRNPLFLVAAAAFLFFGFMFSVSGIRLPDVYLDAPYSLAFLISLLSMGGIFVAMVFCANAVLRDSEYQMRALIYVTPVQKVTFLFSRFAGVWTAVIFVFSCAVLGMMIARWMPWLDPEDIGSFQILAYLWPFFLFAIPNLLVCSTLLFLLAVLTQNRIAVYLGGLFLYLLYVIGSMYSGAPWLAGVSPASPEAMSLAAKIDPFGLSAFFEQTQHWSILQRNTQLISLSGNLLFNRLLWIGLSIGLLGIAYASFSFRKKGTRKSPPWGLALSAFQSKKKAPQAPKLRSKPISLNVSTTGWRIQWQRLRSLVSIEFKALIKQIPFLVVLAFWTVLLMSEVLSAIAGGIRMPASYPTTSLMISNIMTMIPFFGTVVLIFYSNELIWRNKLLKVDTLIDQSPNPNWVFYLSRFLVLILIPFLLITVAIVLCICIQVSKAYFQLELGRYVLLYLYAGLPLLLIATLALFLQSLFSHRYLGMLLTGLILLLTSSPLGRLLGVRHSLFRYGTSSIGSVYSDLNGFGAYTDTFDWQMLYWGSLALILAFLTYALWQRGKRQSLRQRISDIRLHLGKRAHIVLVLAGLLFGGSGCYIFVQTNILQTYQTGEERQDWAQGYEETYKQYQDDPQPTITAVKADVDLYPKRQRYEVRGEYLLQNTSDQEIRKALLYLHQVSDLGSVQIDSATILSSDETYGHHWIAFDPPLKAQESRKMDFTFSSGWSGFSSHDAPNAIVSNGTFIRMSRYFPIFGYQVDNEISQENERRKRSMYAYASSLPALNESDSIRSDSLPFDYQYISFETTVSTISDQIAVAPGRLIRDWVVGNRRYFHYKVDRPIPFRFAYSSAEYERQTSQHNGIDIEVLYHPAHAWNVDHLIQSAQQTIDYCSQQFGMYQYDHIRLAEVSNFTGGFAATAYPGTVYILEDRGFRSDLRNPDEMDMILQLMAHEISHQWWGGQIAPRNQEGGIFLTESMAQYTEFILYEQVYGKQKTLDALDVERQLYVRDRGFQEEVPLYKAGRTHPHIPYSKGAMVLYGIKELIGEQTLNQVLHSLIEQHAYPQSPPTSLDFLTLLYESSPPEIHPMIEDWMTRVVIYDVSIASFETNTRADGRIEVELRIVCEKEEEDTYGNPKPIAIHEICQIGLFRRETTDPDSNNILYLQEHLIRQDTTILRIVVDDLPQTAAVDPYAWMIDRDRLNNVSRR